MASNGDVTISWMRRTRVDGDNWSGREVPLGEEKEFYHVRIIDGNKVVREFYPNSNHQIYYADEKTQMARKLVSEWKWLSCLSALAQVPMHV